MYEWIGYTINLLQLRYSYLVLPDTYCTPGYQLVLFPMGSSRSGPFPRRKSTMTESRYSDNDDDDEDEEEDDKNSEYVSARLRSASCQRKVAGLH